MARSAVSKPSENGLKRLEAKLIEKKPRGFSVYLRENFERIEEIVERAGRDPSKWTAIAEWAVEERLAEKLSAIAAKRAYERERVRVRKAATKTRALPAAIQSPAPVRDVRRKDPDPSESDAMNSLVASLNRGRTQLPGGS